MGASGGTQVDAAGASKLHELLQVDKDASEADIKKAYRRVARRHHPDKGGELDKFVEVTNAYRELTQRSKGKGIVEQPVAPRVISAGLGGEALPEILLLAPTDARHAEIAKYFADKWRPQETWGKTFTAPNIARIYQLDFWGRRADYAQCQRAWKHKPKWRPYNGDGNEQRRFHGTRLECGFVSGAPCTSAACSTCCILRDGRFLLAKRGTASSDGVYGDGLYFTACSHTAKGYGLKDPNARPPKSADFAKHDAGNAVFIVNVLAGRAEVVAGVAFNAACPPPPMPAPDPTKFDSRVVNKGTGVDELVVFDEKQALPRYLIVFGAP